MPTTTPTTAPGSDLAARAETRRAMNGALTRPCYLHGARRGDPCWTIPAATPGGAPSVAVCQSRRMLAALRDRKGRTR